MNHKLEHITLENETLAVFLLRKINKAKLSVFHQMYKQNVIKKLHIVLYYLSNCMHMSFYIISFQILFFTLFHWKIEFQR